MIHLFIFKNFHLVYDYWIVVFCMAVFVGDLVHVIIYEMLAFSVSSRRPEVHTHPESSSRHNRRLLENGV